MWFVLSLQLVRFHTLTYLSQPAETLMGLLVLGENRTQLTQSWWPSSVMVYLHWASVFHSLMVLSQEPDRAKWPSEERTTSEMKWEWPCSRFWGTVLAVLPGQLPHDQRLVPAGGQDHV